MHCTPESRRERSALRPRPIMMRFALSLLVIASSLSCATALQAASDAAAQAASASSAASAAEAAKASEAAKAAKAASEAQAEALASAIAHYPAAALTPTPFRHAPPDGEVERAAPPDEAAASMTLGGVKLHPRNEQCFPTETRNLFSEVDKVVTKAVPVPHPIDWNSGNGVPEDARSAIMGQNTWMLWGEGNEAFWGWLQQSGYGIVDFLVLINSKNREHRFRDGGLINQPEMVERDEPLPGLGLYIDRVTAEMAAPASDVDTHGKPVEQVRMPARNHPSQPTFFELDPRAQSLYDSVLHNVRSDGVDPLVYGYPSGVVGLRLWPNPDFFGKSEAAEQARAYWKEHVVSDDGKRYYSSDPKDADFHADPKLIRPFRVSMACSFCHVGPHPLAAPGSTAQTFEHPAWGNLSSTIGNQYWLPSNAFSNMKSPESFLWQFVASQPPGTIDTSLVATDHINNPNTINAIFEVKARLDRAAVNPPEKQSATNLMLRGTEDKPLFTLDPRHTPRVLLDGADSIGIEGALLRVYLNIGAYSGQWRRVQNTIIGFTPQRPFDIATIKNKSVYWQTTERFRVAELESFFTHVTGSKASATQPMKLASTAEGAQHLNEIQGDVLAGRKVFIERCAVCHSSKQLGKLQVSFSHDWRTATSDDPDKLTLPTEFADWEDFVRLSKPYIAYVDRLNNLMKENPEKADEFFKDNYLSTDVRVPVTLVGTNSQRAVGTNAMRGQVWDNFSSETYKSLPAVGLVHFYNPFDDSKAVDRWGNNDTYAPPSGGPGYYRPASLVSLWATAPFLHNNSLGLYNRNPTVHGRLVAFDDAIDKLLNQSKRAVSGTQSLKLHENFNKYPAADREKACLDNPADQSIDCSALRGDFRPLFAQAGVANRPGFRDVGFIYRTTKDSYIDFSGSFIRPLVTGIIGGFWTDVLFVWLWVALGALALVLILFGRARLAGGLLALLFAVLATLLRGSGLDGIYLWLWVFPLIVLLLAIWFLAHPESGGWTRAYFAVSALAFFFIASQGKSFLDGDLTRIHVGPIPRGTPVNLIMNINPDAPTVDLLNAVAALTRGILIARRDAPEDVNFKVLDEFQREAGPALLKASKCPDFVMDRGHWFGDNLSTDQKRQLKAFLQTL